MSAQFCALTDHVCLEVRGTDAASFLHAQLSQAIEADQRDLAPLAAWHDARGRVRALLRVWPLPDRWVLVTPKDGAQQLLQRLRLFVLRSAVTLDISADLGVAAILDADDAWLAAHELPLKTTAATLVARGPLRWLCVTPGYWQVLGPKADVAALGAALDAAPTSAVDLAEIRLGLPAITSSLVEHFVPQMLNLDALGALSFHKGCYPGQEIIARVHNLGGVKRRLRRYATTATVPPAPGQPVLAASGEPVGEIVRSAPATKGSELLAVVEHTAADGPLFSGGAPLRELPLPFDLPRA